MEIKVRKGNLIFYIFLLIYIYLAFKPLYTRPVHYEDTISLGDMNFPMSAGTVAAYPSFMNVFMWVIFSLISIMCCILWIAFTSRYKMRRLHARIPGYILFLMGSLSIGFGSVDHYLRIINRDPDLLVSFFIISLIISLLFMLIPSFFLCFRIKEKATIINN